MILFNSRKQPAKIDVPSKTLSSSLQKGLKNLVDATIGRPIKRNKNNKLQHKQTIHSSLEDIESTSLLLKSNIEQTQSNIELQTISSDIQRHDSLTYGYGEEQSKGGPPVIIIGQLSQEDSADVKKC